MAIVMMKQTIYNVASTGEIAATLAQANLNARTAYVLQEIPGKTKVKYWLIMGTAMMKQIMMHVIMMVGIVVKMWTQNIVLNANASTKRLAQQIQNFYLQ